MGRLGGGNDGQGDVRGRKQVRVAMGTGCIFPAPVGSEGLEGPSSVRGRKLETVVSKDL